MFCSRVCLEAAIFHKAEVKLQCIDFTQRILLEALNICDNNFDKLQSLSDDTENSNKTIYEFDWRNQNDDFNSLLSFNSLQLGPLTDDLDYIDTHPVLALFEAEREREIAKAFMIRVARIQSVNSYSFDWWTPRQEGSNDPINGSANKLKVGSGLLRFGSLFNHSCAPNIDRIVIDNKFVFFVRRPIKEGEQLFISYGPSFIRAPSEWRQEDLKVHFDFICACEACQQSYPLSFNNSIFGDALLLPEGRMPASTIEWQQEFRRNCRAIEENQSKFPSAWLCRIMDRNLYLLAAIARNEPFMF